MNSPLCHVTAGMSVKINIVPYIIPILIFLSSTPLSVVFDGLKNENWKKELFQSRIIDVYFHPEASNILGNFFILVFIVYFIEHYDSLKG